MSVESDFVLKYYKDALDSEKATGVPALFTLAQAALESGWGKHAPGNMFFGIKAGKSWKGKRQLLRTTEYLSTPNSKAFPEVISVTPVGNGKYKYVVRDWFRAYDSPRESFIDHGNFFIQNKRYSDAFKTKDSKAWATAVAKAGYATAPDYASILHKIIDRMKGSADQVLSELKKNVEAAKLHVQENKGTYLIGFLLLAGAGAAYYYRNQINEKFQRFINSFKQPNNGYYNKSYQSRRFNTGHYSRQ